jgi:hypothetical protein
VAAEAHDRTGCGVLVLRDDLAPLLGVELLRERRRANEVAEENRQMPPLAGQPGVSRNRLPLNWCRLVERVGALRAEPGFRRALALALLA